MLRKILLLLSLVGVALAASSSGKVENELEILLRTKGSSANIFIKFQGGNSAAIRHTEVLKFGSRAVKTNHLAQNLKSLAEKSQRNARKLLETYSTSFTTLWVSNEIYVENANAELVTALEAIPEVEEIRRESKVNIDEVSVEKHAARQDPVQWNIDMIETPAAWALPGGNDGTNVVVGSIDTGARSTHEALRNNFRTPYGWYDPYEGLELPFDGFGTGTSTMGVLAGHGGIGVAPGSQWIACRGCEIVGCEEYALKACGQWMICPTLPDGSDEDCRETPNIVINGWRSANIGDPFFDDVIAAWRAAGIIPLFPIGGYGPVCASTKSPGDKHTVIGVGGTNENDTISERGSRGPSFENKVKPDIVAPGDRIYSAWANADDEYYVLTGTTMGVPHVAGVAAMLLSRDPTLTYEQILQIIDDTADRDFPSAGEECGGIPDTVFPNNIYGHGRVNARRAMEAIIGNSTTVLH